MNTEKTCTPLYLDVGAVELSPTERQQPLGQTVVSEADQKRIDQLLQRRLPHRKGTKEYKRITDAIYYLRNRTKIDATTKAWHKAHPEKMMGFYRRWRSKNPEKAIATSRRNAHKRKEWAKKNPERRKEIALGYYYRNRPPIKPRVLVQTPIAIRTRNRRKNSLQFMLGDRLRASLNRAFRRNWVNKPARTEALLGCTIAEAKAHLEAKFTNGMSWENRSTWHIDHFVPIVAFDMRDLEEIQWCFNYRNLQPLPGRENLRKQATIPNPLPEWLPAHIADWIRQRTQ